MNSEFDVAIIGGGAAGIGAARQLAASAHSTLHARGDEPAWGARMDQSDRRPSARPRLRLAALGRSQLLDANRGRGRPRRRSAAGQWGVQHRHLGFSPREQKEAGEAFDAWFERLSVAPPPSDRASDALPSAGEWNGYLEAISGFISGAPLNRISIADYLAYDSASTGVNWRAPQGYGDLIVASVPSRTALRLATPVEAIALEPQGVAIRTPRGDVHAKQPF